MNINNVQIWIGLVIGVSTFLAGILAWYAGAIEKKYAAQRDFQHLKKNQEQIVSLTEQLFKEQDRRFDEIQRENDELKALFMNVFMNSSGESISAIMRKRNHESR